MKKVIVALSDKKQIITTEKNAKKNNYLITYKVTVRPELEHKPLPEAGTKVPAVGTLMYGFGGHVYCIKVLTPVHKCCLCEAKGKNRIHTKFYCDSHYHDLVVTNPIKNTQNIPKRNAPCHCGSKRKYKQCCLDKDRHTPRHYYLSDYKSQ